MKFTWLLVALTILTPSVFPQTHSKPKKQKAPTPEILAQQAADQWLALIDAGKFAESWQASGSFFQAHITEGEWQSAVGEAHGPLGEMKTRKLKSATYSTSLPGMPNGKYVVLEYESTFSKQESALENITVMVDKDGMWRVSGYFIR